MSGQGMRVASYRFTATFGRSWGGYLSIVLLIGLVGGLALASLAGARRTASSFGTYLASTNPSNMSLLINAPNETQAFSRLPDVSHVATYVAGGFEAFPAANPSTFLNGTPAQRPNSARRVNFARVVAGLVRPQR